MHTKWVLTAAVAGGCAILGAPAGPAAADESAQDVISRLQSEGYTVKIDRIGSAPNSECVVTSVRNPQTVKQWEPYIGPGLGRNNGNVLVEVTKSKTISVSLDCTR